MSNADEWFFNPNQGHTITRQLEEGVRALMLDTHVFLGRPYLCHVSCLLGGKPLEAGLREIRDFLASHPGEVITILFESHVPAYQTASAFERTGLIDSVHTQRRGAPWPTLREMIASGRRLVVFTETGGGEPAWLHPLWDFAVETPYRFASPAEFSCRPNRGGQGQRLFVLNHFVTTRFGAASADTASLVNRREVLLSRARRCMAERGRLPNFVAVDHYERGDLFRVVREINGLPSGS